VPCGFGENSNASPWVGIGGITSTSLIQTGTESACQYDLFGEHTVYRAWYELPPTSPVYITSTSCGSSCTVSAGDSMFAEVKKGSGSTWAITIQDLTQNWTYSTNQTYSGDQDTGEWVVEPHLVNGNPSTLSNYNSTSFFNNSLNGVNPQHSYLTDSFEITSTGDATGTPLSNPSYPNNLTDAFSVYYCPSTGCPTANPPTEGWSVQSSLNGTSTINQLSAITSTSTSDAWAIGYSYGGSGDAEPLATHWNGSTWGSNAISGNAGDYLLGISAISSSNVLAVGYKVTNNIGVGTVALQYDGTSWSSIPSDSPSIGAALHAVGSDSSGDAWAVGETSSGGNNMLIEKYIDSSTGFQNWTLTGSDSTHTAVIGNLPGTTQNRLFAVTVNSSTDAWAVGSYYDSNNHEQPLSYHWDGTRWTNVTAPNPTGSIVTTLSGVTEISPDNVWAVGYYTNPNNGNYQTYLIHSTGAANGWSVVSSPNPGTGANELYAVSAVNANEVYAVGLYGNTGGLVTPLVLKYSNGQWQPETAPSEGSGLSSYGGSDLSGVTVPAPGEVFTVGYFGENSSNYTLIDRRRSDNANIIAWDNFQRTNQTYWGTASDGNAWGADASNNSHFSMSSNTGLASGTSGILSGVLGPSETDEQALVTAKTSSFASGTDFDVLLRYTDSNNWYKAYLDGSNIYIRRMQNGTNTQIASAPFSASANMLYTIRFQVIGEILSAKVWAASGSEPANWTVSVDDTNLTSGKCGIGINNSAGANLTFTSFTAYNIPTQAVPTPAAPSGRTLSATDTFQRANQTYWGTASDGSNTWGADAATSSNFTISSNTGKVSDASGIINGSLGATTYDSEVDATASTTSFSGTDFGVLLRYTDNNNWYKAYLDGSNLVIRRMLAGNNTQIASASFNAAIATPYSFRLKAVGYNLYAKVWAANTPEPSNWTVTTTDTNLISGKSGVGINNSSANTVQFTYFAYYSFATPATLGQDTFQRANQAYWGTASDGNTWAWDASSNSAFSISSNSGQVTNTGNTSYSAILGPTATNAEVLVTGELSSFTDTPNIGAVLRFTDGNNWYKAYFDGSNLIIQKKVSGTATTLQTASFSASANTLYSVRFRISGTSLSAKVWAASGSEPTNWTATATDSSQSSAGYTGLRILTHSATATVTSFTAISL
jgi:hypothetical protein